MFLEFLNHALALDLQWIAGLVLNNLHWVFLLAAFVYIEHSGKKWLRKFILLVGALYLVLDIVGIWNLVFLPIFITVIFAIALDFFAEGNSLANHKTFALWVFFFATSFIWTFFWLG